MTGDTSVFPQIDLVKHRITQIDIDIYAVLDKDYVGTLTSDSNEAFQGGNVTQYVAENHPHRLIESAGQHRELPEKFLLEVLYDANEGVETEIAVDPTTPTIDLNTVVTRVTQVEEITAEVVFSFEKASSAARRLLLAFPVLSDASVMYPMRPEVMPVDFIGAFQGIKERRTGDQASFDYFISVSDVGDGFTLLLGFYSPGDTLDSQFIEGIISRAEDIVKGFGIQVHETEGAHNDIAT